MKTRYTPLVKIKKSDLDRSERELLQATVGLNNAESSLSEAYGTLQNLQLPQNGKIQDMLSARSFISAQRNVLEEKKKWLLFAQEQVALASSKLKISNIEYEKFQYLEVQEIKKVLKQKNIKESKDLDEIATMTYNRRKKI